ncbi:MAG: ABC transporter substrate-binding protein [Chloroflexi bacterium]|nr:ABC transporter substrate-binding protein [Chloroflexota bacterium]
MRRHRLSHLLFLVAAFWLLVGCTQASARPTPAVPTPSVASPTPARPIGTPSDGSKSVLNVGLPSLGGEVWTPGQAAEEEAQALWFLTGDPILGVESLTGTAIAATRSLASEWKVYSPGETPNILDLRLRAGVQFHKGFGEMTGEDFKFTVERLIEEGSKNPAAPSLRRLLKGNTDAVTLPETHLVRVKPPIPETGMEWFFSVMEGFYAVVSRAAWEQAGAEGFAQRPVSTGPFEFVEHVQGERIALRAVVSHWRKVPSFSLVNVWRVPEEKTRVAMLMAGQLDVTPISTASKDQVETERDIRILRVPRAGEISVILGGQYLPSRSTYGGRPPYESPWVGLDEKAKAVRKALNLAVDREALLQEALAGEGRITGVPHLMDVIGTPWYDSGWRPYPYQPNEARRLLSEAGYAEGFPIKAVRFSSAPDSRMAGVMERMAGYWERVGIRVSWEPFDYTQEWQERLARRQNSGYAYPVFEASYPEPYMYLECCYHSLAPVAHWEFELLDRRITAELRRSDHQPTRAAVTKEIGSWLYDNYISVPVASMNALWAVSSKIELGWRPTAGSTLLTGLEYTSPSR